MEKLKKFGKELNSFARFLFGFAIALSILSGVMAVAAAFINPSAFADATEKLTLGALEIEVSSNYLGFVDSVKLSIAVTLVIAAAKCAFIAVMAKLSQGILVPIKDGTPFAGGISSAIKKLAFAVLIGGGIMEILGEIADAMLLRMIDVNALFSSENVVGVTSKYEISLTFVGVFIILYMLSLVFRYGEELQRQSDETL